MSGTALSLVRDSTESLRKRCHNLFGLGPIIKNSKKIGVHYGEKEQEEGNIICYI